jgi:hypothetical protein
MKARSINDVLEYFGYLSNGKLSQEQMASFVNFEAIHKFEQNIKNQANYLGSHNSLHWEEIQNQYN